LDIVDEPADVDLFLASLSNAFSSSVQPEGKHQADHDHQDFYTSRKPVVLTNRGCDLLQHHCNSNALLKRGSLSRLN
jgi:hypothetical protein